MTKLPDKPTPPQWDISRLVWLIYGARKIGKTSLASQFEDALLIFTEPGGRGVHGYKVDVASWEEFVEVVRQLPGSRFKTVVIDTVDSLFERVTEYICKREGVRQPGDRPYGEVWALIEMEWKRVLSYLIRLGVGVIFISHSDMMEIKPSSTTKPSYHRIEPTIPRTARRFILSVADVIIYYGYEEGKRTLYVHGDEGLEAGCRVPIFRDEDGHPLKKIEVPPSPEELYQLLKDLAKEVTPA